ncbi:MAG TPA: hypothetical protein VLT89_13645 [Usitatibacter sp.]|nr:hypothetical protein [Usitatibacter sp.]
MISTQPSRGLQLRRAASRYDWSDVRALRFAALAERGDLGPQARGEYGDEYDSALNSCVFVLAGGGEPLGSTRTSVSSPERRWALPAADAFAGPVAALGDEATLVEASLTVIDPRAPMDAKAALFHLFKAHMLQCALENADWLVAAVRDSQIGFYRRVFNMEILSGAEAYGGLASPRVLMGLDFRAHAALLFKRIPVLAVSEDDERNFTDTGTVGFGPARRNGSARRAPYLVAGD